MKHLPEEERKKAEHEFEEKQKKHKDHPKMKHPVSIRMNPSLFCTKKHRYNFDDILLTGWIPLIGTGTAVVSKSILSYCFHSLKVFLTILTTVK